MPISLKFKTYTDAYDLASLHPKLREILNFVIHECSKEGVDLEITSVRRMDGGVHQYNRGVDVVPVNRSIETMEWIRKKVNENFDYGKGEIEVCPNIYHGSAPHNHLQVRESTRRRERANT